MIDHDTIFAIRQEAQWGLLGRKDPFAALSQIQRLAQELSEQHHAETLKDWEKEK
jgi:hypothetical protein